MADLVRLHREHPDKFTSSPMPRAEAVKTMAGHKGMYELLEPGAVPKAIAAHMKPARERKPNAKRKPGRPKVAAKPAAKPVDAKGAEPAAGE